LSSALRKGLKTTDKASLKGFHLGGSPDGTR